MEKWAQSMNKKKSTITIGTKITQTTSSTTSLSASPFTSSSQTSKKAESSYMTELEMLAMKEEPEQDKKVLSRKRVTREHINLITRLLKLNKNTNYECVFVNNYEKNVASSSTTQMFNKYDHKSMVAVENPSTSAALATSSSKSTLEGAEDDDEVELIDQV